MKASIWILTYRRPEQLPTCLATLNDSDQVLDVNVVVPEDELVGVHEIPKWVNVRPLPQDLVGIGAGAPRRWVMENAIVEGDDAVLFLDDDSSYPQPAFLKLLIEDLERFEWLGMISSMLTGFIKDRPWKLAPFLVPVGIIGGTLAIRTSVIEEVGNFDDRLVRLEDMDICYRAQVAGWVTATDDRVHGKQPMFQDGGLSIAEGKLVGEELDTREKRKMAADVVRIEMAKIVAPKFGDDVSVTRRGHVKWKPGRLIQLKERYVKGEIMVDVNGVHDA